MASSNILPGQGLTLFGQVRNPATEADTDGAFMPVSLGQQGQVHVANIHGQWYTAARRGNLFIASTAAAGVTIPVEDTTQLASTAGIVNPITSGVVLELVGLMISNTTIDVAVKPNVVCFQKNLSTSGGPPTTVTALTAHSQPLSMGTSTAKCVAHSAATFTNSVELTPRLNLIPAISTAVGTGTTAWYQFNGEVLMGPDTAMAIVNSVTAIAGHQFTYIWAEWPV
jgi:hypothetical protein